MRMEKVCQIRDQLRATQSRHKSYVACRKRNLKFEVGDLVFLRVSPTKEVVRFRVRGKLSPRYIGQFEIREPVGEEVHCKP